jgi:hypothetical protein
LIGGDAAPEGHLAARNTALRRLARLVGGQLAFLAQGDRLADRRHHLERPASALPPASAVVSGRIEDGCDGGMFVPLYPRGNSHVPSALDDYSAQLPHADSFAPWTMEDAVGRLRERSMMKPRSYD